MKLWHFALSLVLVAGALAGCGGEAALPADEASSVDKALSGDDESSAVEQVSSAQTPEAMPGRERYTSAALDASYEGALPASTQLALGIVRLNGTENAVAPEQAKALLPLWHVIQAGSLQSDAERNAVVKQIESSLTAEQLSAIADMKLTFEDMEAWMQEQSMSFGPPHGGEGGQGPFGHGGEGSFDPGGFADLSEEERAAMRATAEASGMTFGRPGGAGRGQLALIAEQVVELLAQLAGE